MRVNFLTNLKQKVLWAMAVFFLAGPFWVPFFAAMGGHNSFFYADMVVSLGISLTVALLGELWLPEICTRLPPGVLEGLVKHTGVMLGVILTTLLVVLGGVNQSILHRFLNSADEHSCYFLAECLRRGKLLVKPHPLSEFFNVVHVGNRDGKWFSVYPPGWPALWALGSHFGVADWMNPIQTTLAVFFLFISVRRIWGASVAWAGTLLIIFSPFFLFTGASYYSHATCLLMMSLFLYAFLRWQAAGDETSRSAWALLAGAAAGYGLMTRYLTMAAFAAPFLFWHYGPLLRRKRAWRRSDLFLPVVMGVFMLLILFQNYAVTGKLFKAPNKYDKSWERLGFKRGDYMPGDGLVYVLTRFFYLMDWYPPILIAIFLVGCLRRMTYFLFEAHSPWKRTPSDAQTVLGFAKGSEKPSLEPLLRGAFFYPSMIYFLYFSWGGNQYGPRYWWEAFPFLGFALADQMRVWWRQGSVPLRKFLTAAVLVSLPAGAYAFNKQAAFFGPGTLARQALYTAAETSLKEPAIVFIHGFLGDSMVIAEEDAVRNSPQLDGKILYAHDLGAHNRELMQYYPERKYYRGTYDRKSGRAVLEKLS